jgi:hypothetical protein
VAAVVAAVAAVSACGESAYHYVSSSEAITYYRVPSDWRVFEEDEIFASQSDLSPQQERAQRARQWITAFDGAPRPTLGHISQPSPHPSGLARVFVLGDEDHDNISLKTLRSLPFDGQDPLELAATGDENVEVIESESVTRPGGLRGVHIVINQRADPSSPYVTTNYLGLLDNETRRVYALFVSCSADCYVDNESKIKQIVDSWTVKER